MTKSLTIANPAGCIGCCTCGVTCMVTHSSEQELDADILLFRLKIQRLNDTSAPVMCHQCENVPYVGACPMGVLTMGEQVVQASSAHYIGCQSCVSACPFGMITTQSLPGDTRQQIVKYDLCEQREGEPACVESCPTQALQLLTERKFRRIRQRHTIASGKDPLRKKSPRGKARKIYQIAQPFA